MMVTSNQTESVNIFPILLVNFIGILGYSVVIPILIFIVIDMGGNGFVYGILGAMYPLFQFFGAPILGDLSDRIGRKKVLLLSQAGSFIAWCLFLLAFALPTTELWSADFSIIGKFSMTVPLLLLFLARMFDGFTGGNISVANAYLSDISTDKDRNSNFGKMGASTSTGFVLGPAIAGLLASTFLGESLPILVAALISLLAIYVISTRLKETNPCVVDTHVLNTSSFRRFFQVEHRDCYQEGEKTAHPQKKGWSLILKQPGVPFLFSIYFLTFLAFSLFYVGIPIYASSELQWTAIELGVFLAVSSGVMILVQGPLLSRLSNVYSSKALILVGALLLSGSFFLLYFSDLYILYLANILMSIGNGLMWPSFLSLLAQVGDKHMQGAIQGYGNSMGSLASMMGLVLGGILFENIATLVFTIGAVIFLVIFLLVAFENRSKYHNTEFAQSMGS